MSDFSGKNIVVTGGASGIGLGIAARLAHDGAHVFLVDIDGDGLERAVDQIGPERATAHVADLASIEATQSAAQAAIDQLRQVHGLVNNAGIGDGAMDPWKVSAELWDRVYAVNVRAQFLLIQAVSAHMHAQGIAGAMVNISSGMTARPVAGIAYCSSKAAVLGLTQIWTAPLGERGIRINSVLPGLVDTPIYHKVDRATGKPPGSMVHGLLAGMLPPSSMRIAVPRVGQPADIAGAVSFLLSDEAAYISGQSLIVDGGYLYG